METPEAKKSFISSASGLQLVKTNAAPSISGSASGYLPNSPRDKVHTSHGVSPPSGDRPAPISIPLIRIKSSLLI